MVPAPAPPAAWTLLLGPGPRTAGLLPALVAIAQDRLGPGAPPVQAIDDPVALLGTGASHGRLLIDADAVAPHDLGILRRFLAAHPGWDAVVTGGEEGSRTARGLLALEGPRWRSWPLDVDQLELLVHPGLERPASPVDEVVAPTGESGLPPEPEPAPILRREELRELEEDLEAIEAILANAGAGDGGVDDLDDDDPDLESTLDPRDLDLTPEEIEAFYAPAEPVSGTGTGLATATATAPAESAAWAPPAWYRDQVADLADRAQRLELAMTAAEEEGQRDALVQDVAQMTQFARTLGFLVAPPGPGEQEIVLGTLLEELLAGLAGARPDSPRYLFRPGATTALVRSDKGLLVAAFDALLQLADACSGRDDVVRVSIAPQDDAQTVLVTFPAGPLAEVPSQAALTPYALHRVLPAIGPNALAAAARILQGQGGDLAFGEGEEPGQRLLRVTLPRGD